jgi:hypothetical protein
MTKNTLPETTRDLKSSHKHKYNFKKHEERGEHLQFECSCRNVSIELSYKIEVHYTVDTYYFCFMTVVACMGTGTTCARLQALEAFTSKAPIPPSTLTPPSTPRRTPSPPPSFVGDIPIVAFESSLYDLIKEYNKEYFDSQEFQRRGEN